MRVSRVGAFLTLVSMLLASCSNSIRGQPLEAGGLYSIESGDWGIRVAKVLVVEPSAVHIRLYKQEWPVRPGVVDPGMLTLGRPEDADGFGVGHLPLRESTFRSWKPSLVGRASVSEEELEGYRIWKESNGGLF